MRTSEFLNDVQRATSKGFKLWNKHAEVEVEVEVQIRRTLSVLRNKLDSLRRAFSRFCHNSLLPLKYKSYCSLRVCCVDVNPPFRKRIKRLFERGPYSHIGVKW